MRGASGSLMANVPGRKDGGANMKHPKSKVTQLEATGTTQSGEEMLASEDRVDTSWLDIFKQKQRLKIKTGSKRLK